MRRAHTILYGLAVLLIIQACQPAATTQEPLRVAIAASLQYMATHLAEAYTTETGEAVSLIPGSSGKLSAQITEGAPYAVFLSADTLYPRALVNGGIAVGAVIVYGYGDLAIWTARDDLPLHDPILALTYGSVRTIAIANPSVAPYGTLAEQWLTRQGIRDSISSRLVFGESIGQVNQYITSGSADIGITSLSTVIDTEVGQRGRWARLSLAPADLLPHGAVATQYGMEHHPQSVERFLTFLTGPTAQQVLRQYGYALPGQRTAR